jgi:phosphoserine phosphatase RsbU/P
MYSILIVDDDPVSQLMLKRILSQQGYHVEMAENGQEGIQKVQDILPALIICDWMMPVVNGLEVCRFVKSHPQLCTSFFVLLTSRTDLEDRIEGLNAGADEFLAKPINMNELKARVRAGLRLHQLNQDLQAQKQALETELAEAASYVRSLLPPPMLAPLSIESLFLPSHQLGGDCFDYFWVNNQTLAIYLLDVSGHGLGAALPSVSILNLL